MSKEFSGPFGQHEIQLTEYWGGDDKGTCIQVTGENCDRRVGYVGLTVHDAYLLIGELARWIKDITECRAEHVAKEIAEKEEFRNTIFDEVAQVQHFISDLKVLDIPIRLNSMVAGGGRKE